MKLQTPPHTSPTDSDDSSDEGSSASSDLSSSTTSLSSSSSASSSSLSGDNGKHAPTSAPVEHRSRAAEGVMAAPTEAEATTRTPVRRPPLAASSASSLSSCNISRHAAATARHAHAAADARDGAPSFISFSTLPTATAAEGVLDGLFPSSPSRAAGEKANGTQASGAGSGVKPARRRTQRRPRAQSISSSSSPSASSPSSRADVAVQPSAAQEDRANGTKRQRRDTGTVLRLPAPPKASMGLMAARALVAELIAPPPPPPRAETDSDHVIVYINNVPTQLPRTEPLVHPAALFAPKVLLLDTTTVVRWQHETPAALTQHGAAAQIEAALTAIRRERDRLWSEQNNLFVRKRSQQARAQVGEGSQKEVANAEGVGTQAAAAQHTPSALLPQTAVQLLREAAAANAQGLLSLTDLGRLQHAVAEQEALKEALEVLQRALYAVRSGAPTYVMWHHYMQERRERAARAAAAGGVAPVVTLPRCAPVSVPPPPSVLLLPSPATGLVRLTEGHHYLTVKFVGEHLRLTGRLAQWLPTPVCNTAAAPEETNDAKREAEATAWASMELRGLLNYLRRHPGSSAEDYFKLAAEEMAIHTMAEP